MRALLALALAGALRVAHADKGAPQGVTLDWSMRVQGVWLDVDYRITNRSNQDLHVVDTLTLQGGLRLDHQIVLGMEEFLWPQAKTNLNRIVFAMEGCVPSLPHPPRNPHGGPPIVRKLRPGESHHWIKKSHIPLAAWAPSGQSQPLDANVPKAILLISYFSGDLKHAYAAIPEGCDEHFLVGKPTALPAGVTFAETTGD
jgi:hypothetical protein